MGKFVAMASVNLTPSTVGYAGPSQICWFVN